MEFLTIYPGWIIAWSIVGGLLAIIALTYAFALIADWRVRRHNREREKIYLKALEEYEAKRRDVDEWHSRVRGIPTHERPPKPSYPEHPIKTELKYEVDWGGGWHAAVVIVGAIALIAAGVQSLMMIPYDSKYWSWYTITGEVTDISTPVVQLDEDTALIPQYYIQVEGFNEPIFMNDPRIEAYEGETVSLLCGVEWRSFGEAKDRWSCNIRETN